MQVRLKNWKKIPQKTLEWYEKRNNVITASDVSSILEINPFSSKYEVLLKKSNFFNKNDMNKKNSNPATEWGEYHEPFAKKVYETIPLIDGERYVHDVGLIYHSKYKWLAASPDGIVESLEKNPKHKWWLLEIKCPYRREFKNKGYKTPSYIWIQIQIQMEVCDLPFCHLLQCKYYKNENKSTLLNKKITTIWRDKNWFNNIALPKLQEFWELINKARKYNNFANPYPNPKEWVPIHSFTGFLVKDPIIDWLNMYEYDENIQNLLLKYPKNNSTYKNNIRTKENVFNTLIEKIKKYGIENKLTVLYITDNNEKLNESLSVYKYENTKKALQEGADIIIRPVLLDYKRKIHGIPDIIMKNKVAYNYLKTHNNINGISHITPDKYSGYTIFCTTLKHNFPKKGLLSKWDNVLKSRYSVFLSIVNSITNNNNNLISFIGTNTCLILDPTNIQDSQDLTISNGIEWIRTLRNNGREWLQYINNNEVPKNSNIMPNMCNKFDQKWRYIKRDLAERWGELTLLWYCGINQRNKAHEKGVYSWKEYNNKKTSEDVVLSLYSDNEKEVDYTFSNRKRIIKSMIELNRSNKIYTSKNFGEITEPYIDTQNALEVYIDFEVLSGKNINKNISKRLQTPQNIIYLIGMQWKCPEKNNIEFNSFISSSLTISSEKDMLKEWWNKVKELKRKYDVEKVILYHWSAAEERFLKKAFERHSLSYIKSNLESGNYDLRDLMEMYIDAEVVIRGVWGYSVKDIAKGLHKHGLISEVWDDTEKGGDLINSGEGTIVTATNCYKEILNNGINIKNNPNFTPIINYNKMDCNVLYHLLYFLRTFVYSSDPRQKRRNKRKLKQNYNYGKRIKTFQM